MNAGWDVIVAERKRQVNEEGFSEDEDANYTRGELLRAGNCYRNADETPEGIPAEWPWDSTWWKPTTPERNLVKAGALYLAEVDRLERAQEYAKANDVIDLVNRVAQELEDMNL